MEYNLFAVQFSYEAFNAVEETLDRPAVISRVNDLLQDVERFLPQTEASGSGE